VTRRQRTNEPAETDVIGLTGLPAKAEEILPDVDQFIQLVERRSELVKAAIPIALASTTKNDWCTIEGRPYPKDEAIEKIRLRFGISAMNPRYHKDVSEDEKGTRYIWSCEMDFTLPGSTEVLTCIGTASNRKPFYAKRGSEWKKQYEIHEENIKKHAWTNCMHNGITRIIGIRGISKEELQKHVKFKMSDVDKIEYDGGGNKPARQQQRRNEPPPPEDPAPTPAKAKTKAKTAASKKEPSADAEVIESTLQEFLDVCDYLIDAGATEEQILEGYLAYPKPAPDGSTYPTIEQIQAYKTKRAITFLQKAIVEIKSNEDMSGYDEFLENSE
jgi:hypothetical protein